MQIQFVFIILFVSIIAPLTGCTMVMTGYVMDFIFGPLFLYLFYKFYRSAFKPSKKILQESTGNISIDDNLIKGDENHIFVSGNVDEVLTNGNAKALLINRNIDEVLANGHMKECYSNGNAKEMITNGLGKREFSSNGTERKRMERSKRPKGD